MYSKVYLEITNVCNKNCSFCIGTTRPKRFLSTSEFDILTDKLKGVTSYLYLHVMGEPLLHPDIEALVRLATAKGFKVCITTNGSLLGKVGASLINAGAYKVNISLHSFEGHSESEHHKYLSQCADFADKASQNGVLCVFRLWNLGTTENNNDETFDFLKSYFKNDEWVLGKRGYRIRNKLHLEYAEQFKWPDLDAEYISDRVSCYGLKDHFAILSNGSVVPCCLDREANICLGNAFEQDILQILESDLAKNIKKGFENKKAVCELCKRCGYATRFKV